MKRVVDGDTIDIAIGGNTERVRLIGINTPETKHPTKGMECFGQEARTVLISLLATSGELSLRTDPKLDKVDRYGRLLRYVFIGNTNVNLRLVELGAAAPYFYKGDRGQYSSQILKAARNAKAKSLGLWKSCPGSQLTATHAITTVGALLTVPTSSSSGQAKCDVNYAGCIPVSPSDIDCADIKRLGLAPVKVIGIDIHKLDRDGDGVGCDK
jgi:micrococcal nuclease